MKPEVQITDDALTTDGLEYVDENFDFNLINFQNTSDEQHQGKILESVPQGVEEPNKEYSNTPIPSPVSSPIPPPPQRIPPPPARDPPEEQTENEKSSAFVGRRIELKWSSGKWYRGTVTAREKLKHKVIYDDGDVKWYYLPEMVFRLVEDETEWDVVSEDESIPSDKSEPESDSNEETNESVPGEEEENENKDK